MMKNFKEKLIVILIISTIVFSIVMLSVFLKKYDDVDILSLRKEYNLVLNNKNDTIDIPLYIGKRNTFLSNYNEVESVSITNDSYAFTGFLKAIEMGPTIRYNENKFYEYVFHLSFESYDEFVEPVFMSDCLLNITYRNGNGLSYQIGNMNLYFNTQELINGGLLLKKLQAVTNEVDGIETIVGLNMTLYNDNDSDIKIKKIEIKNKHYELDYMNYEEKVVGRFDSLVDLRPNYHYIQNSISKGDMDLYIQKEESEELFIALKYVNEIEYLDRLPLYITYEVNNEEYRYIQDDFLFLSKANVLEGRTVVKYVYRYH